MYISLNVSAKHITKFNIDIEAKDATIETATDVKDLTIENSRCYSSRSKS